MWAVALLHLARVAPPVTVPKALGAMPRLPVDVDDPDLGRFYAPKWGV